MRSQLEAKFDLDDRVQRMTTLLILSRRRKNTIFRWKLAT